MYAVGSQTGNLRNFNSFTNGEIPYLTRFQTSERICTSWVLKWVICEILTHSRMVKFRILSVFKPRSASARRGLLNRHITYWGHKIYI